MRFFSLEMIDMKQCDVDQFSANFGGLLFINSKDVTGG